jgi:hypothetical protein
MKYFFQLKIMGKIMAPNITLRGERGGYSLTASFLCGSGSGYKF